MARRRVERLEPAGPDECVPRPPLCASADSNLPRSTRDRSAPAATARSHPSASPTGSLPPSAGRHRSAAPVGTAPTGRVGPSVLASTLGGLESAAGMDPAVVPAGLAARGGPYARAWQSPDAGDESATTTAVCSVAPP